MLRVPRIGNSEYVTENNIQASHSPSHVPTNVCSTALHGRSCDVLGTSIKQQILQ